MADVEVPLDRYESKVAVLRSSVDYPPHRPSLSDHTGGSNMYVKPEPSGEFLAGGIERPRVDDRHGLKGANNAFLRRLAARIGERLPEVSDARLVQRWSGVISVTPDAHQIVGVPDSIENLYLLIGGSGHGFKETPAFAESAAQTLLGIIPTLDLEPYRLERFADGETFDGVSAETYGGDE